MSQPFPQYVISMSFAGALSPTDLIPTIKDGVGRRTLLSEVIALVNAGLPANVNALGGLTGAADRLAYFTNPGAMSLTTFTATARDLLSKANYADMRTAMGVGNLANGGTGGTNAATARTNLGVTRAGALRFEATKDGVTAQVLTANALNAIALQTLRVNSAGLAFSTSTGLFTCAVAGDYVFSGGVGFTSGAADEAITAQLYVKGARYTTGGVAWSRASGNGVNSIVGPTMVTLAVGDTVEIRAFLSAAANRNANVNAGNCYLNGMIIS